ncbi:hypothetical protein [Paenibacillus sp. GCM10027626]|uniref:hypothetical protein n=1 Tax=Paenibacillus sp. GCM10027626 TaxID=3273411 RepID=UPI00362FB8B1
MWMLIRSLSIAVAMILGLKPLFDGHFGADDFIFPVFAILATVAQIQLNKQQTKR